MKQIFLQVFSLCGLITWLVSCQQGAAPVNTALTVYRVFDSTRLFDTTVPRHDGRYYRPVKIDFYYPSTDVPGKSPMSYGAILEMYEQRLGYDLPEDSCKKVAVELAKMFGDYLHVPADKLMSYKTGVYEGLAMPRQKCPLVVYAAGMNGSSWENICLFDSLVQHGYTVAAISSVGKYPGYMSDAVDIPEQVNDVLFAIKKMKQFPFIDSNRIGLLSWSLGGTAITKAAMVCDDIKCLLSMDGTELHYYGIDTAWDRQYRIISGMAPADPRLVRVPYMYLSSEHPRNIDSVDVFPRFTASPHVFFLKFRGAIHEDFSSLPTIAKTADTTLGNIDSGRHQVITRLAITFFDEFLKGRAPGSTQAAITQLVADKPRMVTTDYPR